MGPGVGTLQLGRCHRDHNGDCGRLGLGSSRGCILLGSNGLVQGLKDLADLPCFKFKGAFSRITASASLEGEGDLSGGKGSHCSTSAPGSCMAPQWQPFSSHCCRGSPTAPHTPLTVSFQLGLQALSILLFSIPCSCFCTGLPGPHFFLITCPSSLLPLLRPPLTLSRPKRRRNL